MNLEAKTLTLESFANDNDRVIKFIPEVVDGNEVYSVRNEIDEHCGYITEALFNLLLSKKENEDKVLIHNALSIDDGDKDQEPLIFGKKIILDVSSTNDIDDFEKIVLTPVTYTKGAKPLTIKIGTFFCVQNGENNNISQTINELEIL